MSATKPGDFGEPLSVGNTIPQDVHPRLQPMVQTAVHVGETANRGNCIAIVYLGGRGGTDLTRAAVEAEAARIVACVNALDGKAPEALPALIEAAAEAVAGCCNDTDACCFCGGSLAQEHVGGCPMEKLRAALAAFGVKR